MPKGGRSMTTEQLNLILKLCREGVTAREISEIVQVGLGSVGRIIAQKDKIDHFTSCPACGNPVPYRKNSRGRKRVYCNAVCRHSQKIHKSTERVCLNCGKHFVTWKYKRIKYCCHSCYVEHRYGKRLQDKSS